MTSHRLPAFAAPSLALVLLAATLAPPPAGAAESYDGCTAMITSLPAVITTSGVHCLSADLGTSLQSGGAITIATNNVTIDCNYYKVGGSAAGVGTQNVGIVAVGRNNVGVRRCLIRGFRYGVQITPATSFGHLVEDNRLDNNLAAGLLVQGDGAVVRNNVVTATGSGTGGAGIAAIRSEGSVNVVGNTINGVTGSAAYGIEAQVAGRTLVQANTVRGLVTAGGPRLGIRITDGDGVVVRANTIQGDGSTPSIAVACGSAGSTAAVDNVATGMGQLLSSCFDGGNNVLMP